MRPRHYLIPRAIEILKDTGYQLVTVAECLGLDPYLSQGKPSTPDVRVLHR